MFSKRIITIIIATFMSIDLFSQTEKGVIEAHGLEVGAKVPMFKALDAEGLIFNLQDELKDKAVVLIFYRGFWCPVCNKHLSQIQDSLQLIEDKGVKVIAISPEKPEYLDKMAKKSGAKYTLLYDEGNKISKAFDVNFKPTSKELFTYNVLLMGNLKKSHSDNNQQLPIPATFLINTDGKIAWRQFDRDYHNRASVADIIKAIDKLNKEK